MISLEHSDISTDVTQNYRKPRCGITSIDFWYPENISAKIGVKANVNTFMYSYDLFSNGCKISLWIE